MIAALTFFGLLNLLVADRCSKQKNPAPITSSALGQEERGKKPQ